MPRARNYFVVEVLDPGTDADGKLGKAGVRMRWTAGEVAMAIPGMRDHLSAVAKELSELAIKRMGERPRAAGNPERAPNVERESVPVLSLGPTDDKSPRERALEGA